MSFFLDEIVCLFRRGIGVVVAPVLGSLFFL